MSSAGGPAAILGGIFQGFGYMQQQSDLREASLSDAQEWERQAKYTEAVGRRRLNLLEDDQDEFFDRKKAMFAKAGVGYGDQFTLSLAGDKVDMQMEQDALRAEIDGEVRSLRLRRDQANAEADRASDPWRNFLALGGIAVGAGASAASSYSRYQGAPPSQKGMNIDASKGRRSDSADYVDYSRTA